MTSRYLKASLSLIFLIFMGFMLVIFRSIPVSRIWNNYSLVYFSPELGEKEALSYFHEEGCSGIISLSSQTVPLVSPVTPVIPEQYSEYLIKRLGFFSDLSGKFSVLYIPSEHSEKTKTALEKIIRDFPGVKCGMDSRQKSPYLSTVLTAAFLFVFAFFAQRKSLIVIPSIPLVLLVFSRPFFSTAAAVFLLMTGIFLLQNLWKRAGALKKTACHPLTLLFFTFSSAIIIFQPISGLLLSVGAVVSSALCIYLINEVDLFMEKQSSFNFVPLFSAKQLPLVTGRTVKVMIASSAAITLSLILFLIPSGAVSGNENGVMLPSPQKGAGSKTELCSLDDFYEWSWLTLTFPYRNLNDSLIPQKAVLDEEITFPRYVFDSGEIMEYSETVLTYGNDFFNSRKSFIMDSPDPNIEKLLISENAGECSYSALPGSKNTQGGNKVLLLILMALSAAIPLAGWLYYRKALYAAGRTVKKR